MLIVCRTLLALTALLVLAGCATGPRVSTQTMPRVDFGTYETFGWVEEIGTNSGSAEDGRMTRRFKAASRREMEALGYRYTNENPDLLLNFFVNAQGNSNTYVRASRTGEVPSYYDYRGAMYRTWTTYEITSQEVDYAVGTITIDVVDAAERRLIWEGRLEGEMTQRSLINPDAVVSESVTRIFGRFPLNKPRQPSARSN